MGKRIFISPSNQDGNRYAYGNTTEDVQCGIIGKHLEAALLRCGFETKYEQYDTIQNRVKHSDDWDADMHVAIHTNATAKHNAGGTQVFYYAQNGYGNVACKYVFDRLKSITPGSNAEVCKQYSGLYEVNKPKATSVYVEAEFHDVVEYAKWIIEHTEDIAEAICMGICDYYKVEYVKPQNEKPENTDEETEDAQTAPPANPSTTFEVKAGNAVTLRNEPYYKDTYVKEQSGTLYGTYYFWSSEVIRGRAKITTDPLKAGIKGQVLGWINVPDNTQVVYVVKRGDTLGAIAKQYGTTVAKIAALNNIKNVNLIHVGQQIKIPK